MKKRFLGALMCLLILISLAPTNITLAASESLFDRFIPIEQVYSAYYDEYPRGLTAGDTLKFYVGTRFDNEMGEWSPDTLERVKRSSYQGGFIKLRYLGTYGSVERKLADEHMCIVDAEHYLNIIGDPNAPEVTYEHGFDLNKDTSVIAIDLYDANKKFVRSISPGCIIVASTENGEFLTYSNCYHRKHYNYFSLKNDIFAPGDDYSTKKDTLVPKEEKSDKKVSIEISTATVHKKSDIEKLLSGAIQEEETVAPYLFTTYEETSHPENINANILLNDHEFITPDNTYYYIGLNGKEIDPVVLYKLENVVSYSYYFHSIEPGYTQRNVVTADGTLYGLTDKQEKKVLATNVAKTSMNHYMTKDGKVIELKSGKVIATNCKDFAEANSAWAIGVIKNDDSFWLGYTYLGDKAAYKKGLEKKLDKAKLVVPEGVVDENNTLYRWNETVTKLGMDENAWMMGQFIEKNDYNLNLTEVCRNVIRVFPNEKLSRIGVTNEELVHKTLTGFALTSDGTLHGFGLWYNENFGNYGMVEKLFPVRKTVTDGNFIGILSEGSSIVNAVVCRTCDNNRYKKAPVYNDVGAYMPEFLSVTRNGYLATDGCVYSFTDFTQGDPEGKVYATANYDRDFGQMHRESRTFKAYGFGKEETINLLPSVTAWEFDNKRTCLLERSDGSVWMAAIHPNRSGEPIFENLDGFENSNAIQVSQPTTKKAIPDYIAVSGNAEISNNAEVNASPKFTDVPESAYYAEAVKWAVDKKITAGTSATTFSPDNTCTRAQILTFLWRAVGSPKMAGSNPFSDVKTTDYFYDAALWASEKGMVSGSTFAGDTPCTRAATVVYLYKNAGSPKASYGGSFSDVTNGADYAQAVAWAVDKKITSGTSATTFSPDTTCTRGQIVTFLLRALK